MFDFILSWNIWEKWLYQTVWGEETNHSSNSLQTHKIQYSNTNKSPTPKFIVIYKLSVIKILKFFINKIKRETKMSSSGPLQIKRWSMEGHGFVNRVTVAIGSSSSLVPIWERERESQVPILSKVGCNSLQCVSMSWLDCSGKEFVVTLVRHKFFYASEGIIYRSIWKYFSS